MFGFAKKKKAASQLRAILNGGNDTYASFVKELFDGLDGATKAHVLVAYQNLIPIFGVMNNVAKKQGSAFSVDDFIIECSANQYSAKDEVNARRYAWFMWAALVYRLATMSGRDFGLRDTLAEIWCDIARCAPFLKDLLPDNAVWKAEEKVWFEHVIHDPKPEIVAWAINHGGPKTVWNSPAVKKLAEEYGLVYLESVGAIGPITYQPTRPASKQ